MTEIFSIIAQTILLLILSCLPYKLISFVKNKNLYLPSSILVLSFFLLIFSFLNIKIQHVEFFLWGLAIVNIYFLIKEKKYLFFFNSNFLIFYVVFISLSLNLAVDLKLGWDAQNYWIIKTLNFICLFVPYAQKIIFKRKNFF